MTLLSTIAVDPTQQISIKCSNKKPTMSSSERAEPFRNYSCVVSADVCFCKFKWEWCIHIERASTVRFMVNWTQKTPSHITAAVAFSDTGLAAFRFSFTPNVNQQHIECRAICLKRILSCMINWKIRQRTYSNCKLIEYISRRSSATAKLSGIFRFKWHHETCAKRREILLMN